MARVPLLDGKDQDGQDRPELAPLVEKIRGARRGTIINVYRLLLHAPSLAECWLELINAVRWKTKLSGRLREIAILRVGYLLRVPYIINQHVPRLALPEGLTLEECAALANWAGTAFFDTRERAMLAYVDSMTTDVHVPEAIFAPLRDHFDDRQIVELSVLIGTYNMHARVMASLAIDPEPPQPA